MSSLNAGDKAPDFNLPGTGDRNYRLSDYAGETLVLAFYPGDFTSTCTRQFCAYRDKDDQLRDLGVSMLGISPQSVESHVRFTSEHGLTIPLLADEKREMAKAYGVLAGPVVRRAIFVIDGSGVIRHRQVALLGLSFQDVDAIAEAVAAVPSAD